MPENFTAWRQGHVLRDEDVVTLNLVEAGSAKRAIVITHDCDIPNESEDIEVILGELCASTRINRGARQPRVLDLTFPEIEGSDFDCIRLKHSQRYVIKRELFVFTSPDERYNLKGDEKRILKQWLASRYGRPAFPDVFEHRLRVHNGKISRKFKFESEIAKIIGGCSEHLLAVFFDLGNGRFSDLPEDEPYELSIYLVYDSEEGSVTAREEAEAACSQVENIFREHYGDYESAEMIALDKCMAVADTKFTLASLKKMDQWRLEYISLDSNEKEPFISVGS